MVLLGIYTQHIITQVFIYLIEKRIAQQPDLASYNHLPRTLQNRCKQNIFIMWISYSLQRFIGLSIVRPPNEIQISLHPFLSIHDDHVTLQSAQWTWTPMDPGLMASFIVSGALTLHITMWPSSHQTRSQNYLHFYRPTLI